MNPDSTLAVTQTCPKDGVHLSAPRRVLRVRGVLRVRRETALGVVCLSHPQAPFKQVHPPVIMLSLRLRTVSASLSGPVSIDAHPGPPAGVVPPRVSPSVPMARPATFDIE